MDVFSMVFTFIIDEMIFMKSFTLFTMKSKLCLDEIKACVFDEIKSVFYPCEARFHHKVISSAKQIYSVSRRI